MAAGAAQPILPAVPHSNESRGQCHASSIVACAWQAQLRQQAYAWSAEPPSSGWSFIGRTKVYRDGSADGADQSWRRCLGWLCLCRRQHRICRLPNRCCGSAEVSHDLLLLPGQVRLRSRHTQKVAQHLNVAGAPHVLREQKRWNNEVLWHLLFHTGWCGVDALALKLAAALQTRPDLIVVPGGVTRAKKTHSTYKNIQKAELAPGVSSGSGRQRRPSPPARSRAPGPPCQPRLRGAATAQPSHPGIGPAYKY